MYVYANTYKSVAVFLSSKHITAAAAAIAILVVRTVLPLLLPLVLIHTVLTFTVIRLMCVL
jgi:hypothetical protein